MEIRLGKIYDNFPDEGIKIEFNDFLTVEQFQMFQTSISEIEELHYLRRLLDFVTINQNEIINFLNSSLQELLQKSTSWNGVKRKDSDEVFLNTNRLFLNYLSSIRTFLDHSETSIKRKFKENSPQFLEFKNICSFFYDNSFAYRFFYKLRNYSQHVGLPINNIEYSTEYDRVNNEINGILSVTFNRDKLISSYDSWGAVKNDLQLMDAEFDITPQILEMTHNIIEIERNIKLLNKTELFKAANFITELTKHLQSDKGVIFIAYNFETKENDELARYESIHIPFDTIDIIKQSYNES